MDGVAVALQPAEEAKGEDADEQADQRQQDPHPCDDVQEQVVHAVSLLWEEREQIFTDSLIETYMSHAAAAAPPVPESGCVCR